MAASDERSLPRLRLHALGSNGSGQLGIGHTDDVATPHLVSGCAQFPDPGIANIASGGNHTVILCKTGTLASVGSNEDGRCPANVLRLANTFTSSMWSPEARNDTVVQVAATWTATIWVSARGSLCACGSGSFGELGAGADMVHAQSPTVLPDFPPDGTQVVKLASSMAHVVVVLSNGEVWGWGNGRRGQLGRPAEIVWTPRKIQNLGFSAVDAVCGKDFTFIVGSPDQGSASVLGVDRNDRFGVKANAPQQIAGWKQVVASWGSIFVLKEDGKLHAWGRNDHGQLPPIGLPPLKAIAAGSEHCLGLTNLGQVVAWGWGEHGNCSIPTDDVGDVKQRWNVIHMTDPVEKVFAGCATSFLVSTG